MAKNQPNSMDDKIFHQELFEIEDDLMDFIEELLGEGKEAEKSLGHAYWTKERKDIYWKLFAVRQERMEQLVLKPVQAYFHHQGDEVVKRLHKEGRKVEGQYAGWSRQRVRGHVGRNKSISDVNIDKRAEARKLGDLMTPIVRTIMKETGDGRMRDLSETTKAVGIDFNVNDPSVLQWLGTRMRKFSREVSGTTFDAIEAILREGFSEGEPLTTIAETLRSTFDSWEQHRAATIARTETISAMNKADLESVVQSGMEDVLVKHWLSSRDANVRQTHQEADDRYVSDGIPIDEEFEVGDDRMLAPGLGSLAEEVCNCRCTVYYSQVGE